MSTQGSSKPSGGRLWQTAYHRLRPELESWLLDTGRFLLIFASLLLGFAVFKLLRALGLNADFIDQVEKLDHYGITSCFVLFLLTVLRRALAAFFASNKE